MSVLWGSCEWEKGAHFVNGHGQCDHEEICVYKVFYGSQIILFEVF